MFFFEVEALESSLSKSSFLNGLCRFVGYELTHVTHISMLRSKTYGSVEYRTGNIYLKCSPVNDHEPQCENVLC